MDFVSLALFGAAVVALGAAATVLIARWLPQSAIEQAARHGRYAGLGEAPRVATARRAKPGAQFGPRIRPQVGKEAINVVRTH
ncbi:hypothetical protein C7402_113157 [Paraburkholderia unamae]|uniref:Uncharacterized protein n=1 Tax=Paraburkholderia unamae TaxID=219649 RepID=A0ABX5KIJ1_9BURK|nr:hypothetical protein C7402_113157 [Paraburkholderia unamae]